MKKTITFLLLAFLLIGCEPTEDFETGGEEKELYDVSFSVSNFSQSIEELRSSAERIPEHINSFQALIFDHLGNFVDGRLITDREDENFGKVELRLPEGQYSALFSMSSEEDANVGMWGGFKKEYVYINNDLKESTNNDFGYDIFANVTHFSVGHESTKHEVTLQRGVAKVEIKIPVTNVPKEVYLIEVNLPRYVYQFKPFLGTFLWSREDINFSLYERNSWNEEKNQLYFGFYTFVDVENVQTLKINAYDKDKNIVFEKTIENLCLQINRKTVIEGNLFGSIPGFDMNINPEWDDDIFVNLY